MININENIWSEAPCGDLLRLRRHMKHVSLVFGSQEKRKAGNEIQSVFGSFRPLWEKRLEY